MTPSFLFVDLAGSERIKKSGVTGEASHEATRINSSLTILGRVVKALADGVKHVPYRESTLTQLLQPIFTDRAACSVIVNVASEEDHAEETVVSLRFAKRLTGVKISESQVEGVDLKAEEDIIQQELRHTKRQLEIMTENNLHGHFLLGADPSAKKGLTLNMSKLSVAESHVMRVKLQLREAESVEPNSAACRRLEERLLQSKNELDIIEGIVARQKTIPGLWKDATLAFTKTEAQVQHFESLLALH